MLSVTFSATGKPPVTLTFSETTSASDQTRLVQSALDAVAGLPGGHVTLSAGVFTLAGTGKAADGALRIGSETVLEGAGAGLTTLQLADGSTACTGILRTDSGKTLANGGVSSVANVVIRGLTIDGNRTATTGDVDGFYSGPKPGTTIAEDRNILIENVEITNCSRYGFDPHEGTRALTIRNSSSHDNGRDGFTVDGTLGVVLENCSAYGNGRHGFNLVTGTANALLLNCDARNNVGSGLAIQTGDNELRAFTHDIDVVGGTFVDNGRAGIDARQVNGLDVSGSLVGYGRNGDCFVLQGVTDGSIHAVGVDAQGTVRDVTPQDLRVAHYLQTFGDTDPLNDVVIRSGGLLLDGVALIVPPSTAGAPVLTTQPTAGADTLTGTDGRDVIAAGGGDDTVNGGLGRDALYGNDGDDRLDGGADNDQLFGGWGNDRLYYSGGVDVLDGGAGTDAADFIRWASAVNVDLNRIASEAHSVAGAVLADFISIENVKGSGFNDVIAGSAGANSLEGWNGDDRLIGRGGNDKLTGGAGRDVFVFDADDGRDVILDFKLGSDRIELTGAHGLSDLVILAAPGGTNVIWGLTSIVLQGIAPAQLSASSFIFD